jgi:hypothetical protein
MPAATTEPDATIQSNSGVKLKSKQSANRTLGSTKEDAAESPQIRGSSSRHRAGGHHTGTKAPADTETNGAQKGTGAAKQAQPNDASAVQAGKTREPSAANTPTSGKLAGQRSSECGSERRCAEVHAYESEQNAASSDVAPPSQCPSSMTTAQCENVGKAIEGGGTGAVTQADQCPAGMSEAECRALGEAYEAATK